MAYRIDLGGDSWLFKCFVGSEWLYAGAERPEYPEEGWLRGTVPGSVHSDLIRNSLLPDPYWDMNSLCCEWVSQRSWVYRRSFKAPEAWRGMIVRLRFEGVDYRSRFYLNGRLLGDHEGMCSPVEFDISGEIIYGGRNLLVVGIDEAPAEQPQIGHTSRVRSVKSRMAYGWDFSARLIPLGIWGDVSLLITGDSYCDDLRVGTAIRIDGGRPKADVRAEAAIVSRRERHLILTYSVTLRGVEVAHGEGMIGVSAGRSSMIWDMTVDEPELWWPNDLGGQPLYTLRIRITDMESGGLCDERELIFGIREIGMEANEDAPVAARGYTFIINGKRLFIKGMNWVPVDLMHGRVGKARYRRLLNLARKAGVNLIRVWGGGYIEKEEFYDLCDRYGIMIWQEFMLSSSGLDNTPPTHGEYIRLIEGEARAAVISRRNHASLALWCGGNELTYDGMRPIDDCHPAVAVLKRVVEELDPGRIFLPSSPGGPAFGLEKEVVMRGDELHDIHGPWHYRGIFDHYLIYNGSTALFHSEFGCPGSPSPRSLVRFLSEDYRWPPDKSNPAWLHHGGSWWTIGDQLEEIFGPISGIVEYISCSQALQAEGLGYAIEQNRRRAWRCSGVIPWQFNEPWPNASCTSIIDYYGIPKMAYYRVMRAYGRYSVTAKYPTLSWRAGVLFDAEIWLSSEDEGWLGDAREGWPGSGSMISTVEARILDSGGRMLFTVTFDPLNSPEISEGHSPSIQASRQVGRLKWMIPEDHSGIFFLLLDARGRDGERIAWNEYLFSSEEEYILRGLLKSEAAVISGRVEPLPASLGHRIILTNHGPGMALFVEAYPSEEWERFTFFDKNFILIESGSERSIDMELAAEGAGYNEIPECHGGSGWMSNVPNGRSPIKILCKGWNTNLLELML